MYVCWWVVERSNKEMLALGWNAGLSRFARHAANSIITPFFAQLQQRLRNFSTTSSFSSKSDSIQIPTTPPAVKAPSPTETLWAMSRHPGENVLRNEGMVSGIISDFNPETGITSNELVCLKRKQIWGLLTTMGKIPFLSHTYGLEMHAGPESDEVIARTKVIPRKIYLANGCRKILNLALMRVRHDMRLKMHIPLKFSGRTICPGLNRGGILLVRKKSVTCLCFPNEIPPYVEVNVGKLNIGEKILVQDLNVALQYRRQGLRVVCEIVRRSRRMKKEQWEYVHPKCSPLQWATDLVTSWK